MAEESLPISEKIRVAPHSKESEMIVLGAMLTGINSLNIGADSLSEQDFYFTEHKLVFQVLKSFYCNDKPADIHLVSEELKRQNKLSSVGGVSYLTTLAQYAGTSAFLEEYIDLVKDKSVLRNMINAAQDIERSALNNPEDVHILLDDAQAKFFLISQKVNSNAGILVRDILSGSKAASQLPYLKELQAKQEQFLQKGPENLGITGIPTHFMDLDKLINGLGASNLMILAARPAMGKTALALNIVENVAFKNSLPVGIFSLEMTAEQLLHRMICSQAEVESDKIRTGSLNGIEYQRVVASVNAMMKGTIVIDDQPGLKITDLRARARRMKESHQIQLLVVDYLQLLSGSGLSRNSENRQNEISEISRMMKTLARELNLPILCLSQLSRKVEERQGHRPMMSDLRESGCLAGDTHIQDANTGALYTIKQLAEQPELSPLFVYAVDRDLRLGKHKMIKVFFSGKKCVYELVTRSGRTIKASGNHPFLKKEGWTALEELHAGDKIGVPRFSLGKGSRWKSLTASLFDSSCSGCPAVYTDLFPSEEKNTDLLWDEILSITEQGVEDVYDATVEGVHNFLANDILVHNSIEQDSDIVLFLLRREYYDPYDKPGMAELIVAKNRHGAVGSVNLTYRKELAQFANYSPTHGSSGSSSNNEEAFAAFSP